jgi:hypothetical protein
VLFHGINMFVVYEDLRLDGEAKERQVKMPGRLCFLIA